MAYQLVSNVSLPGFELTYGSQKIGLLDAWSNKRLYIGPSTTSTSSSSGSAVVSYSPPPKCSNCSGTGCMYCQKGGKSRRRRLSTRRRRRSNWINSNNGTRHQYPGWWIILICNSRNQWGCTSNSRMAIDRPLALVATWPRLNRTRWRSTSWGSAECTRALVKNFF